MRGWGLFWDGNPWCSGRIDRFPTRFAVPKLFNCVSFFRSDFCYFAIKSLSVMAPKMKQFGPSFTFWSSCSNRHSLSRKASRRHQLQFWPSHPNTAPANPVAFSACHLCKVGTGSDKPIQRRQCPYSLRDWWLPQPYQKPACPFRRQSGPTACGSCLWSTRISLANDPSSPNVDHWRFFACLSYCESSADSAPLLFGACSEWFWMDHL